MKHNLFLIIFLFFLNSNSSFSQDNKQKVTNYTDAITTFISWISNLDKVLNKIDDKEKLKRIYRQLGNASQDIDNIALEKAGLARKISILKNPKIEDKVKISRLINIIIEDINGLNKSLISINNELTRTDQIDVDIITKKLISLSHSNQILSLDDNSLEEFLFGSKNQLEQLQKIVKDSSKTSDNLIILIQNAKMKIKAKLDK